MKSQSIPSRDIVDCADEMKQDMIHYLKKLVLLESPTNDPFATREVLYEIKFALSNLHFLATIIPGIKMGGSLYARPQERRRNGLYQLIVGHCDTVWPRHTLDKMPVIHKDGIMKGPGIFDMKSGLVQAVFAIKILRKLSLSPTLLPLILINSDEETGSRESTRLIKRLSRISRRAFILEPPMGAEGMIKTARKGIGKFIITVRGQAAHAGLDPGKGASAILELSHQVQKLFRMNDIEKGISVNVGMIDGGMSANVVAPTATAVVDVRVLNHEDGQYITRKIHALRPTNPDTELTIEGGIGRPPMEKNSRNIQLWLSAQEMANRMDLTLLEATAGGGSDGNTTSQYTATLDGLGTTGDGAHAIYEQIFTDKLVERTALLCHLLLMN